MQPIKITTEQFISKFVDLLIIIEGGMSTLEDPLPIEVKQYIVEGIAAFGNDALPFLHKLLESDISSKDNIIFNNYGYIIDCVGKIKNPNSLDLLIKFHKCCTGFMTSAAVFRAIKSIGTEAAYQYLSEVIIQYASGNARVIESSVDLHIICEAMGLWRDKRGIECLKDATSIDIINGMPDKAICALATYPEAHRFLLDLAEQKPNLKNIIIAEISKH